jgi:hypothetical protein
MMAELLPNSDKINVHFYGAKLHYCDVSFPSKGCYNKLKSNIDIQLTSTGAVKVYRKRYSSQRLLFWEQGARFSIDIGSG